MTREWKNTFIQLYGVHTCMRAHICICMHAHTHTHMHIHTHTHTHTHAYVHTHTHTFYTKTHTTHACTHGPLSHWIFINYSFFLSPKGHFIVMLGIWKTKRYTAVLVCIYDFHVFISVNDCSAVKKTHNPTFRSCNINHSSEKLKPQLTMSFF